MLVVVWALRAPGILPDELVRELGLTQAIRGTAAQVFSREGYRVTPEDVDVHWSDRPAIDETHWGLVLLVDAMCDENGKDPLQTGGPYRVSTFSNLVAQALPHGVRLATQLSPNPCFWYAR